MRRTVDPKLGFLMATLSVGVLLDVVGCGSNDGGIADESGGKSARGGTAGAAGSYSAGGMRSGGTTSAGGRAAGGSAGDLIDGGASGSDAGGTTGDAGSGPGASGRDPGAAGQAGAEIVERCVYHTEAPQALAAGGAPSDGGANSSGGTEDPTAGTTSGGGIAGTSGGTTSGAGTAASSGGAGGKGGGGGVGGSAPKTSITILKSAFVGTYLADSAGKALYLYGADQPGDCNYEPVTGCFKDCLIAWPIFDADPRTLPPGLDDGLFGTITRPDGPTQTTYMGWPLYYYKNDLAPGDVKGHAAGKIWHLAEPILPNIVIMRVPDPDAPSLSLKFLGSENGHTLYTFADDKLGTKATHPSSACVGECLDAYEPFLLDYLSPVSYLEPSDFSYFIRSDKGAQIAYKGAPLYFSYADRRSGDMNGITTPGWSLAAP
jgi:predicted lipoprotein with Yx(FWY)xxD motif